MKHTIRINGAVKKIDCQLGSGILDKNGREIFEGDKVKTPDGVSSKVEFENGVIGLPTYESQDIRLLVQGGHRRRNAFLAPLYIFRELLEIVDD
ncbi:MAG: hypothetical protein IJP68_10215 [Selenomonadaceae bacterium]|nr:hypothetical protein [Selenomonadaceae bacterium]